MNTYSHTTPHIAMNDLPVVSRAREVGGRERVLSTFVSQLIHAVFFIRDIVKIDLGMSHNSSGILPRLVPKTVPYSFAMAPYTTSFFTIFLRQGDYQYRVKVSLTN